MKITSVLNGLLQERKTQKKKQRIDSNLHEKADKLNWKDIEFPVNLRH